MVEGFFLRPKGRFLLFNFISLETVLARQLSGVLWSVRDARLGDFRAEMQIAERPLFC